MKRLIITGLAAAVFATTGILHAQETNKPWTNATEFSAVTTNGNSKSDSINVKNAFQYKWTKTILDIWGGGLGTKSEGVVTAEQYSAGEKVSQKVTEHNYIFENFEWDSNRFAGHSHRYNASGGVGREILHSITNNLILELGAGYINEQRINTERNDFTSGRAFTKYVRRLSPTANASQDVEYLHNFEDGDDYRLNANTSLTASITTHFSMKIGYTVKFTNQPPPTFGKTDTVTSAALIVNY